MTAAVATRNHDLILAGPVGSLDAYIQAVGSIPVLTKEHEQALANRFRDDGDLEAARELVMAHLRFVVHIAKGYTGYGLPLNDLIQEGNVGLMKAVKRFDPGFDVRLVSFAVHWIRAEIHEYVLRNWRVVKVATTKAQRKLFFNLRKAKKSLAWLSHEETKAVAKDLGVTAAEVTEMERRLSARDAVFDPGPDTGDDDRAAFTPAAYLPSPDADPAVLLEKSDWHDDAASRMHEALAELDERSQDILRSRWLSDHKLTLHELAAQYGVSAERIRQVEANAIRKLKVAMAA
ncbi:MAG: RNA polymerase sigma factor RpoH [Gammaproteobacteria bacterium]|nr:MAG: RNA polymerase sigma factor RpoH [Gammaproteobacteria bacterium]